ncbi:NAD(P)-dependent oxidoreductase [Taklimakanibacter deserti]|uniref:NAD(P)-dependent oxidoreductase n=1 Tax=Taklimakanibacter deserti TaxID=2267839 RepID=UPI0013C40F70
MDVCLIGLGRMGAPMAATLAAKGFAVRAWTRTERPDMRRDARITLLPTAEAAVAGADAVILMLSDGNATEELLFGRKLAQAIGKEAIVIDMATIGPNAARDHAARLAKLGLRYIDAPVSGGVKGAEAGTLTIFAGGGREDFAAATPFLAALGTPHHLGPVGAGQTAKLANQIMVAIYIGAVAEGLHFAEAQGLDASALVGALQGGFADSAILRQHGAKMAARSFAPGGTCRLHLKDLDLAFDLIAPEQPRLHLGEAIRERFRALVAAGQSEADHSAYFLTYGA